MNIYKPEKISSIFEKGQGNLNRLRLLDENDQNSKNGILIPIAKSKESHCNADFEYVSFIKFNHTHQKLRA